MLLNLLNILVVWLSLMRLSKLRERCFVVRTTTTSQKSMRKGVMIRAKEESSENDDESEAEDKDE